MIVREGLRTLLDAENDISVVAEVDNGRDAVRLTEKLRPGLVLMDVAMPLMNGLEAARQIQKRCPSTHVLVLSAHSDDAYVDQAAAAGAAGYLIKQTSSQFLCAAIRAVYKGKRCFSPSLRKRGEALAARLLPRPSRAERSTRLSSREREVLQLIAEGKANKQTASELSISVKTVEKHRQHLMKKLNIHDTAGLTRYAISSGTIESSIQKTTN